VSGTQSSGDSLAGSHDKSILGQIFCFLTNNLPPESAGPTDLLRTLEIACIYKRNRLHHSFLTVCARQWVLLWHGRIVCHRADAVWFAHPPKTLRRQGGTQP